MMQFPHLSDTTFPNISTVNVYKFQNNFDYTRWSEKTLIKLCNVIWNSDYRDVVKFDTNELRDEYFDSLDDYWALELETSARIVPEGYIKLPIPYDVIARYNYVFIDMPIATSSDAPLDYENNAGIRRWYFFINNITYLSPNATQVFLIPDVWTNFQNDVDIRYMLLERGHAPVAASDVEDYLENPIANNRYLLAPDVNFDNANITRSSDYVPFGNGTKYVCIASTCAPEQITSLGTVSVSSDYNPSGTITYSNTGERYGYQLQVNGLSMGNGRDYSNAITQVKTAHSNNNRIANNLSVYAIAATECYGNGTFFADVLASCPQFLNTVQGCFVVDDACITRGASYTLAGHILYCCVGNASNLLSKTLEKEDFNYPEELQRFAKLYTSPYAQLEITDNDGTTFTVNIEETSTLQVKSVVSVAFPYINERVYVDGIGGIGSKRYSWVDLAGSNASLEMSNSDWFKYCFDWKIPTFALYMDGETSYQLSSFNRNVKNAMRQALVNYHNSMRSANTAYENACDQADVAYTNATNAAATAQQNAYNSADTGKINADNSADTSKLNADNSADLSYRITDRTCDNNVDNLDLANAGTTANEEDGIDKSVEITTESINFQLRNADAANNLVAATTSAEVERSTATSMNGAVGTVVSASLSGAEGGVVVGGTSGGALGSIIPGAGTALGAGVGALGGALIGAVGGGVSAAVSMANLGATTDTAQDIANWQIDSNNLLVEYSNDNAAFVQDQNVANRRFVYQKNIEVANAQMTNSNATSRANATDSMNVAKGNATNAQRTAKTNATNTQTTSKTNASNTYEVTVANSDRTRNNVKNNAGYTREVGEQNAKELLENAKNTGMAGILDARNAAPRALCSYTGDADADYMRTRGIQIKVKTQSDSAIRQAGDIFARYGYTLNQIWDVNTSGLKLMNHFTYWKAAEIWVDDRQSSNNSVQDFIQNMFLNGVTIWNSPTEIGLVNVYDN